MQTKPQVGNASLFVGRASHERKRKKKCKNVIVIASIATYEDFVLETTASS